MAVPASSSQSSGVQKAPPVLPRSSTEHLMIYIIFSFFGAGSAWLMIGALYLEIAVFQEKLGLLVSNRCSLGYQTGALWVPVFMTVRWLLQRCGRSVDYRLLILGLFVVHLLNLSFASLATPSLESLLVMAHVGGASGYLSGIVHQAYLALHCQDVYSPAFWAGDAATGALTAVLVAVQQPELGPEGRLFGPHVVFMSLVPVVLFALVAFLVIDRLQLGFLPGRASPVLLPPGEAQEDTTTAPVVLGIEADAELPQPNRRQQGGQGFELLREVAQAPPHASPPHIEPLEIEKGSAATGDANGKSAPELPDEQPPAGDAGLCASLLPAAGRAQPGLTATLMLMGVWWSFTCWGVGDSLIPYACVGSSPADEGEDCVFHCSIATVVAILVGSNCAGIAARPRLPLLWHVTLIFSIVFVLFGLAAAWGGRWARPWVGPASVVSGGAAGDGEPNGGSYVVVLLFLIRTLQTFLSVTRQRIIQLDYAEEDREVMNLFFYAFTTAANIGGVAVVTWLLS